LRFSIIYFFVLVFFIFTNVGAGYAQTDKKNSAASAKAARARTDSIAKAREKATKNLAKARKQKLDSTRKAREFKMDSATNARKHITDSIKASRATKTDSATKARKHKTDSAINARKYKESKKYRDSVTKSKTKKAKSLQNARQARMDSLTEARKHTTDSITSMRTSRTDSVKKIQKKRTDSLARVKKYKASKRYADSVTLTRRHRSDSIKAVQKNFRDSIAAIRKHSMDSAKLSRTKKLDSTKAVRTKYMDSIKLVRKHKTDSLLKKKEHKDKVAKANEKKKQEALKMKFEIKLKQKREEWSNTTMLKKRWGPVRRVTQNSFTHYNYYFNANRKMEEAEQNMLRVNRENYDSLVGIFPFNPNKDSSLLAADMDSIVHKVSVGIQIHDPRVKWSDDMYLLLGEAYYYKGGYENASIAFRYIIANKQKSKKKKGKSNYSQTRSKSSPSIVEKKKKSKLRFMQHKSVHNDAILWLARTYTTSGNVENAESILSLLEYDENLPDNLVGRLAVEKAFAYLELKNYPEASKQLTIAAEDNNLPEWLRLRVAFLNGQLLQNMGNHVAAAASFEEVLEHFPKIEMDFYARKYIAHNKLMAGNDVADAMAPLKKLLKDNKYSGYYDQVYFVLGKMAAKANKPGEAITYLTKSTKTPKATKKQKALSFAEMGDVYYTTAKYAYAKIAYDSAAKYSSSASKDKNVAAAVQRSTGLNEISGPANTIHDIDSLLRLAALSKKDQQGVVRRYLRDMEKKLQDSITNAESAAIAGIEPVESDPNKPTSSGWYFSNPTLMAAGSADFKRKWGTRPLTDNWRRSASVPLAGGTKSEGAATDDTDEDDGVAKQENGLPTEESLLSKIPNTQQQKEQMAKTQQKAYILLAKAYIKQLEDYTQAQNTLDSLNLRHPAHGQKEEELFLRYQIAVKQNRLDKAQEYANELIAKFPKSQYASMLRPNKSESKPMNENVSEVSSYFDETYALLMRHQYTEALMRAELGKQKYDHPVYGKRFEVVAAMAHAGAGNYALADSTINGFIAKHPADSLTPWAKSVKNYISDMRTNGKPAWYKEGAYTSVKKDTKAPGSEPDKKPTEPLPPTTPVMPQVPATYAYHADSEHYCVVVLPGLDSRTGRLKQAIRSFDSAKYSAGNLELLIDQYSMSQCIFLVRKFGNAAQAGEYMAALAASATGNTYTADELSYYTISASNYKKMFADKKIDEYKSFYNMYYKK
jgi:tetratricopeptide (TPR) repeat protein